MNRPLRTTLLLALLLVPGLALAQGDDDDDARVDVESVQAVLAVQALDGWLLYDAGGQNPLATELVRPAGTPTRRWFYFIPAKGQPVALVHASEVGRFAAVPGTKIEYAGHRDLAAGVRQLLRGARRVAMEYAPDSGIPSLTRVDAATAALVRKAGVSIASSADLVQLTKSLWGPDGRVAHYVAVHHLAKLRNEALAFVAARVSAGEPVTEADVQRLLLEGYRVRGLVGDLPTVAAGVHTADPNYVLRGAGKTIARGDLLLLDLSGAVDGAERPIVADLTWMAYVGDEVPERYARIFEVVVRARDAAVSLIRERVERRRGVKGFEADQRARHVIAQAGLGERFVHRTGHSLDTSREGDGAHLDDYETHDTRNLVVGSGFTVGPGVYVPGDFGLRSEIDLHISRRGLEVTTPAQRTITAILRP